MNIIYFKLAFRNILKNRISSIINIIGFSIGMAACLFIFLFLKYETSFDKFHPNADKIYRVVGIYNSNSENISTGLMWFPVAKDIKNEIPGIEDYCRVSRMNHLKVFTENKIWKIDKLRFVDSNFFKFFNFRLLLGNPKTALNSSDKIVLSEKKATQFFGDKNPLGETVLFNHKLLTVSGVAANPPLNTHLVFDALISTKYLKESKLYFTGYGGGITLLSYLQLSKNVTPQQIEKSLPDFLYRKINKKWKNTGWTLSATLQNIKDIHLSNKSIDDDISTIRSKKSIFIILSISLLVLLLAIVNYIILYTAQKITKIKDISILKIFGAGEYGLKIQTFIEVFLIAIISSLLGVFLLFMSTPFLNTHLHTSIIVGNDIFSVLIFLLLTIFLISFLVAYFSTSSHIFSKSVETRRNNLIIDYPKRLKVNYLVSFQFVVVIVLLISVFIISRQNRLLLNAKLGFDKENIITIQTNDAFKGNELLQFKQDLQQLAAVQSVSLSSQMVGMGTTQNGYIIGDKKDVTMLNVLYTDADFLKCFNVKLLLGRNFKKNTNLDKNAILINKSLAKRFEWKNLIGKKIKRNGTLKVIGVIEDFNFASLENTVKPMLIMSNPSWDGWGYSVVNVRFKTTDIQSLLAQINKLQKTRFPDTLFEVSFLSDVLASNYKSVIEQQKIISFFSFIAILIAIVGLLGLTIFIARTRVKEIGIRKVNGATIKDILILLNKDFAKQVVIAFIIASPIAYYAMRKWLENFAYKTTLSWWIFALAGITALGIALLTISLISLKAATNNPTDALKNK